MKSYADLNLRPRKNTEEAKTMLRIAADIGYSKVAVSFSPEVGKEEIKRTRALCSHVGLDMVTRVDLQPESSGALLKALGNLRGRFEIIAVHCTTKDVSRQAARDRRVDLLNYPHADPTKRRLYFDHQEAALARKTLCALEIDAYSILNSDPVQKAKALGAMQKETALAIKSDVPIVISSGATNRYGLRTPRDLASLLTLVEIDSDSTLQAVSEIPVRIVERNRAKLQSSFVSPGVRIMG